LELDFGHIGFKLGHIYIGGNLDWVTSCFTLSYVKVRYWLVE